MTFLYTFDIIITLDFKIPSIMPNHKKNLHFNSRLNSDHPPTPLLDTLRQGARLKLS